jgi:hypothetical protein
MLKKIINEVKEFLILDTMTLILKGLIKLRFGPLSIQDSINRSTVEE